MNSSDRLSAESAFPAAPAAFVEDRPPEPPAPWHGHHRVTRDTLALILERVASSSYEPTLAERILFNACEFRVVAATNGLPHYLAGRSARRRLEEARYALAAIGAAASVACLEEALGSLQHATAKPEKLVIAQRLELALQRTETQVDDLLAAFATQVFYGLARVMA